MILPIVSAISREVLTTVPSDHKEAAPRLGATRWEMIRTAMLPYARRGIVGGSMLGLGRAIGETIAVTIVIGDDPILGHSIFDQGYSLAAVIANEFNEAAADPLHRAALIGAGLVLFVLHPVGQLDRPPVRPAQRAPSLRPERRGGGLNGVGDSSPARSAAPGQRPPPPRRPRRPPAAFAGDAGGDRAAGPDRLLHPAQGAGRLEHRLLHHRSDGQLLRRPGRGEERDPRDDRDRRLRGADRGPARSRRGALPDRVRRQWKAGPGRSVSSST